DDQFQQLIQLQDESNPDFVAEVVQLYVEDSSAKIDKIAAMLTTVAEPDFNELDQLQAFEVLKERLSVFIQLEAQLKSMAAMQT
ncbi:HPt domain-containing protein, partial [Haematococcus lacustris]